MIDVIVVDDEWYNLEEISDMIEKTGFMNVKKKYQNPLLALEEFPANKPAVAFIDMDMPEINGVMLAEKFIEIEPTILIVFITAWKQYAVRAFDLNAVDYILKPIRQDRFEKMVEKLKDKIPKNKIVCSDILSTREMEVLILISQGLTQNQIADNLHISVSTIKRYIESIYHKLNVNNKVSAIKKAETLNIL